MMSLRYSLLAPAVLLLSLVAGCGKTGPAAVPAKPTHVPPTSTATPDRPVASATPTVSATPTTSATPTANATSTLVPTPTSTATPTHTPTPTITPTPTPTALPATVFGDPREAILRSPVPQSGAPCGEVDTLDFPLDPPDARHIPSAGRDFGVYRSRYGGNHTGEDWWSASRASTLGAPVYSIGHGTVTYAQPLGWGADQGVVIVRHVFPDGTTILSMYGHLDPLSVLLRPGDCVARGEQIGQIGKPRSPPHLHFEIRTHMPTSPGPGYWSVDPTLAGWEPPSLYIWTKRIVGAPGVLWARPSTAQATRGLGMVGRDTFLAVTDNELAGINVLDGELQWRQPGTVSVIDAVIDAQRSMTYAADYVGRIEAFRVPDVDSADTTALSDSTLVPLWKTKLDTVGFPTLMPLPGGGVVASSRRKLFGVSQAGDLLWEQDAVGRVFDWALTDDHLVISMLGRESSLWTIDKSGPVATVTRSASRPLLVDDQVLLYDSDGIYRLNPDTLSAELLYALPPGSPWLGDVVALSDGGLLVAHMDRFDKRLIALHADGAVRWQRSVSDIVRGQQHLLVHDGRAFLISEDARGSFSEVTLFSVDSRNAGLTRIFNTSNRNPLPGESWAFGIGDDRILIDTGGGGLAALDARLAIEAVKHVGRSQ